MTRSASVIIAWENALLSELGRTKEMLGRLARQAAEMEPRLAGGLEILILFDPERVDCGLIEGCLDETTCSSVRCHLNGIEQRSWPELLSYSPEVDFLRHWYRINWR